MSTRSSQRSVEAASAPLSLVVNVFADSGRTEPLRVEPPAARVWLSRVSPAVAVPAPPLPSPRADTLDELPPPPLEIDRDLKPPILRRAAELVIPRRLPRGPRFVELEVRVDEHGAVAEVQWAGGNADSALVRAAIECAEQMAFLPALRGEVPVAVWSRQRFDFARR